MQRPTSRLPFALFLVTLLALAAGLFLVSSNRASASTSASPARSAPRQAAPLTSTVPVVINEVYDSNNPSLEYFELYNTSITATIDLTSYVIYNSTGINYLSRLPQSLRYLSPGQHLAIGPSDLGTSTIVGTGFNNASDYLGLTNSASEVIDVVNWGNFPNPNWFGYRTFSPYYFYDNIPAMPAPDGQRSLSRSPDGRDTDSGLDWLSLPQSPNRTNPTPTPTPGAATATPTVGCEDRYEPDDTSAQAGVLEQNTEQVHSLCRAGGTIKDRDFFQFPAVGGKVYTMLTKDLTGPVDTIITLYDSQGNTLAENDDYQPGTSLASRIDYTFGSSGLYYLQVRDKRSNGGIGYQYTVALISTGALPPTVTTTSTPTTNPFITPTFTPGVCYDAYEPDGVPEAAKLLLIGTTQRHIICPVADADWVRFYARAGKVYSIRTSNLGVGLDSYMYLFDSDAHTILSENDDGGDGVASRIDFYPQRDDWYFVQVKNAGDIGSPDQTYDLSLAVVPGVPQPPGTASPIIAPVVTVTTGSVATFTPVIAPTRPPVPTPTQGATQPTPTVNPRVTTAPEPLPTEAAPAPPTVGQATATVPSVAQATVGIPGVPNTGRPPLNNNPAKPAQAVVLPQQPQGKSAAYAPVTFRLFYDRNSNNGYDAGEGIRGIKVLFLNSDNQQAFTGNLLTGADGTGKLTLPVQGQHVYIPYLGINIELSNFPGRELHSLWLPPVKLPDRVP